MQYNLNLARTGAVAESKQGLSNSNLEQLLERTMSSGTTGLHFLGPTAQQALKAGAQRQSFVPLCNKTMRGHVGRLVPKRIVLSVTTLYDHQQGNLFCAKDRRLWGSTGLAEVQ